MILAGCKYFPHLILLTNIHPKRLISLDIHVYNFIITVLDATEGMRKQQTHIYTNTKKFLIGRHLKNTSNTQKGDSR